MSDTLSALTLATAVGCGAMGGVFFAFSAFVMPALRDLPSAQGIAAMQSINRFAETPAFMTALMGTAAACLGLGVWAVRSWDRTPAGWMAAGSALYLLGAIGLTGAANVPLNTRLDKVQPDAAGAADRWAHYVTTWTAWNHLRALACVAAAVALTVALLQDD